MPANRERVTQVFGRVLNKFKSLSDLLNQFKSKPTPSPKLLPRNLHWNESERDARLEHLKEYGIGFEYVTEKKLYSVSEDLRGNIENFIGFAKLPLGVAGPLRINGLNANGDFFLPLSTSEGALVASIARGCQVITASGGCRVATVNESVQRAPAFVFDSLVDASLFCQWASSQYEHFDAWIATKSSHAKLIDLEPALIGHTAHLIFSYYTGDASGQNMVTICTEAICDRLLENSPVKPRAWFIEGNLSGDKKPTNISFLRSRGKKVIAEVLIPRELCKKLLNTEPEKMYEYWKTSFLGGVQSGSIGVSGHYANALTAIFIACGQDAACVSEASVGLTACDLRAEGLYISVTLPNLIVGTVGGGTGLPTQKECLQMLGCYGEGNSSRFAEVCAGTVLAGEISISAAMASGDFTRAHRVFGRKRGRKPGHDT